MVRKIICLGILLFLTGCSYNHPKNGKDIEDACKRVRESQNYARQASEQIPLPEVLGKTYDEGPIHWYDVIFDTKENRFWK